MSRVTQGQRVYLWAVAGLALWVGIWCFCVPGRSATAIPWKVAPLCAAFLGAMYLSGAAFCGASALTKHWHEVRVIMPLIALWTGGLNLISFFYLPAFDFTPAASVDLVRGVRHFPVSGMGLMWTHRAERHWHPLAQPAIPQWAKRYLRAQGVILCALGLALLAAPAAMQRLWPWETGQLMLQLYSAPLLTYGLGSLSFTRQHAWSEIRVGVAAIGVFLGCGLAGSLAHAARLNGPAPAVALWLGGLALGTAALAALSWVAFRPARPVPAGVLRAAEAPAP